MKDVEKYDLLKLPDAVIIKELRKCISVLETENGKLNAYILELEDKIKKQKKSFDREILSIQKKYDKKLIACQELNSKVSHEERKDIKKELVYNELLSKLKSKIKKQEKQLKDCRLSNDQLFSTIAKLKNQIGGKH